MTKINLDKYYTPSDLAEYCVKKTKEVIGAENITEWLEPSAGAGAFLPYLDNNYLAFDIEPEGENIEQANYLELDLPYFKGRCVIGNPPYGNRLNLVKQFYKKSIVFGDYISFILPISQFNNNYELHDFTLVYSEDLGKRKYSNREVHCCFNIYQRDANGLKQKPKYNFNDVYVTKYRRNRISTHERTKFENCKYDLRICGFGSAIGKKVEYEGQYNSEYIIVCRNHKNKIVNILKNTNWVEKYKMTATPNLTSWMIYETIKEQIPQLV
jgi:hypothetical protein